jgi:hypothetical protein
MHFLPVLGLDYVGQPDDHICWVTLISLHQFILLTQGPINFAKCFWELTVLKNVFFLSWPFWNFFCNRNFFLLNPMKSSQRFLGSKDGSKCWWLPSFPASEVLGQHLCTGLYVAFSNNPRLDFKCETLFTYVFLK